MFFGQARYPPMCSLFMFFPSMSKKKTVMVVVCLLVSLWTDMGIQCVMAYVPLYRLEYLAIYGWDSMACSLVHGGSAMPWVPSCIDTDRFKGKFVQ